jgi:CHASE1-domain containing sensor protein
VNKGAPLKKPTMGVFTLPLLALIVGIGFALFVSGATFLWIKKMQNDQSLHRIEQISTLIQARLDLHIHLLKSFSGLIYSVKFLDNQTLENFFYTQDLKTLFLDIQAIGYAPLAFVNETKNETINPLDAFENKGATFLYQLTISIL